MGAVRRSVMQARACVPPRVAQNADENATEGAHKNKYEYEHHNIDPNTRQHAHSTPEPVTARNARIRNAQKPQHTERPKSPIA